MPVESLSMPGISMTFTAVTPLAAASPNESPGAAPVAETGSAALPQDAPETLFTLYFLRHAAARSRAEWEGPDEARPLTEKGLRRLRKARKGLHGLVGKVDAILTSPYVRARQTADAVADALRFTGEIAEESALVHGGEPEELGRILAQRKDRRSIVLVGHSPDLERWVAHLTTGRSEPFMTLRKGGVCRVDVHTIEPTPRGTLRWLAEPEALEQ